MNKNEWQQVGEDIRKQVQHAIDVNDFSQLSKEITKTINLAATDVSKEITKSINFATTDVNREIREVGKKRYEYERYYRKPNVRPDPRLFNNIPKGSVSGILWMVLGFGTMGVSCLFLTGGVMSMLFGTAVETTSLAISTTTALAGGALGAYGTGQTKRVDRFRCYVNMVKEKMYCSIEDMAQKVGRSKRYVRKDLKRMMRNGMFLQAHLDQKETCFIASDQMYEQYKLTQSDYEQKQLVDSKEKEEEELRNIKENCKENAVDDKVADILREGREYIRIIRHCNDEIPGEEMSEKLDKLEMLVTRIFARVEEEPELALDMQKMLSYYLPTTQKLLEAYRDLDKHDVDVKNVSETKQEIEKTVDTINVACESFLDDLFRDRAWDIQSDISVLNTMLKQDGYIKSEFEKGEVTNE